MIKLAILKNPPERAARRGGEGVPIRRRGLKSKNPNEF